MSDMDALREQARSVPTEGQSGGGSGWDAWVIDATMGVRDGLFCFCPVELGADGEIVAVVTGFTLLTDEPPKGLMAIVHEGGAEAVEAFCVEHEAALAVLSARAKATAQPAGGGHPDSKTGEA